MREFKKILDNLKVNEELWINAINLKASEIELLKRYIIRGIIKPCEDWLQAGIVEEFRYKYRDGISIAPQMNYIKVRETRGEE